MSKRSKDAKDDPGFEGVPNIDRLGFFTGEVAELVGIPMWRLQKFLDSPQYRLSSTRKGTGHGSRRLFSLDDVYKIGIASGMVEDGFAAPFVGTVVEQIEDDDLREHWNDRTGEHLGRYDYFGLRRGGKGKPEFHHRVTSTEPYYYTFPFAQLVLDVYKRIKAREGRDAR
jgi:hypothetical protein